MSLSLKKLDVIKVVDPRVTSSYKSQYIYLEGAANVTQKSYTTSSVSNSSLQFTAQPPNRGIYCSSRPYIQVGIRLTLQGMSTANAQTLVNPGHDALRYMPFSSGVDVNNATFNNYSVSVNLADILHPLTRFNINNNLKNRLYSCAPSMPDQSQLYSSLVGSVRNPLGSYGDTSDENCVPRGGYSKYVIVSNPASTGSGQLLTAVIDFVTTEQFWLLSPFNNCKKETHSFINLQTFDLNVTMLGNASNRFWSRDETSLALTNTSFQFASLINGGPIFSFPESTPTLIWEFYQPKESTLLPLNEMVSVYKYYDTQRFPTDISSVPQFPNFSVYSSNNIQLSSFPRMIYLFARRQNNSLYSSPTFSDTYAAINNISIQLGSRSGLLASCSQVQLYEMSVRNGCSLSYTQWTGGPVYSPATYATQYGTVGSIIALNPSLDLGLGSLESDGKNAQVTFQVNVSMASLTPGLSALTLYIVCVNEGIFSIFNAQCSAQIGVLTSEDILNAKQQPGINYETIKSVGSGDFLTGIKQFWNNTLSPFLQKSKLGSNLANLIPLAGPALSKSLQNLGYGDMEGEGELYTQDGAGAFVGGRMMRDSRMRRRAMM
jgi:hypothetical protein